MEAIMKVNSIRESSMETDFLSTQTGSDTTESGQRASLDISIANLSVSVVDAPFTLIND